MNKSGGIKVPKFIGRLKELRYLNLSSASFTSSVSSFLGNLSNLYLEQNFEEFGNIPTSTQFQTKVDPTIFQGNVALCGPPLTECVGDGTTTTSESGRNDDGETDDEDKLEKVWFFAVVGLGYCHDQVYTLDVAGTQEPLMVPK
uniref:Serine-threonine protein kinase, plant-type n=1 Tax=Solanum tuberosum TaxID=4113 RepID=M1A8D7_SOLTU